MASNTPTDNVTELVDACLALARAHHDLIRKLHVIGLVSDRSTAALTASFDQLDAAAAELRSRRNTLDS